ncbi:kinase-like domain-containing protein [Sparassis latifolia]
MSDQLPAASLSQSSSSIISTLGSSNCGVKNSDTTVSRKAWNDEEFFAKVAHFREEALEIQLNKFRVWKTINRNYLPLFQQDVHVWYGDAPYYVRIVDVPGALSGDILRYKADLPRYDCHLDVVGDTVREIDFKPYPPEELEEEGNSNVLEDDAKELFATLPLVTFDENKHFSKPARTRREIEVLQMCKGSPQFVQLLGRLEDDQLVFPKYPHDLLLAAMSHKSIDAIRKWMLDIVEGIAFLHARGVTYRDFVLRNFLYGDPVVICDLECQLASRICKAPEVLAWDDPPDTVFAPASDIYGLGILLQLLCYANNPRSPYVHWPVLPPFDKIYEACTQTRLEDRPSLAQMKAWLPEL